MPLILLAVANSELRLILRRFLKPENYLLVEVNTYDELQVVIKDSQPAVVVIDSDFPPTGAALCRALRARLPECSILMLVDNDPQAIEAAYVAGASDLLKLPIVEVEFIHRLRLLMERAGTVQLREREAWYRNLFDHATEGIFRCDVEGRLILVNPSLMRLLGYNTPEEALQANLRFPLPPGQTDAPRSVETVWMRPDHFRLTLRLYARPVMDEWKHLLYYEGVAIDITDLRPLEGSQGAARILPSIGLADALADVVAVINSDLDLEHVLDRIMTNVGKILPGDTVNIFLIDEHGIAISVRTHGYTEPHLEQMIKTLRMPVAETLNLRHMFESNEPIFVPDTLLDPNWRQFSETRWIRSSINAPIAADGQVIGFINMDSGLPGAFNPAHSSTLKVFADYAGIAIRNARLYGETRDRADLLERQRQHYIIQLEQEHERLRSLLNAIGDAVAGVLFDDQGGVRERYSNYAFARMLGSKIEDLSLFSVKPDDVTDEDWQAQVINILQWPAGIQDRQVEIRLKRRDGTVFDANLHLHRMIDVRGRVLGDVAVIRDVTAINAIDAYRARFISNAAHELRNPMSSLRTRLYLLQRQPEQAETHLAVLNQVTDHLVNLVKTMLDLSRYETGIATLHTSRVDLKQFVGELSAIHEPLAAQKDIHLEMRLPDEPVFAEVDFAGMNQVMGNLLNNAFNYTPAGGVVRVQLSHSGEQAIIQVQDSGSGIAPEHLPHLFKPFYRAGKRSDSTGLGLAIVKEIVDLHGGTVAVESQEGNGAIFTVKLGLLLDEAKAAALPADDHSTTD